ncbi:MAG: SMC-Scp complex subunit ScpB [Elusimicrobiota bacterium]
MSQQMEAPPLDNEQLKKALESLLFITDHPLGLPQLAKLVGVKDPPRIAALVAEIQKDLDEKGSPVQLLEIAEGFQMATRQAYAGYVRKLFADRMTMKLSTAAHETLSIIAYKQPLTRAEIEQIRGVEVIAALETLLEKRLIKVVGRKETVGRPLMYGSTPDFLRHFGLKSLEELPALDSFPAVLPAAAGAAPAEPGAEQLAEQPVEQPAEQSAETAVTETNEDPAGGQ